MQDSAANSIPIAIIGMGCRFAGDATSPEKLWKMVSEAKSAWSEIPEKRFNLNGWYHKNSDNISTTTVRGGHFLEEDIGLFDAPFFGLSAETASTLDPQYRLLLESVYESLESAGITLEQASGSNTSVFSGAFFHDYQDGHMRDPDQLPRFLMTGNGAAMASNRISHFFNFLGPSMTIDTGCSTSLTALHQACQSLKSGDSDMSVIGGSNLMLNPDFFITISTLGMLSPDGKSYAFDDRANGYGRGEGVASIIIKRLDDAIRDGDPIRAVIRQTLLNQDGKTETITSPSAEAQAQLIRSCYAKAGISPHNVQYFEAHGTGTPTGDPIETRAIASVFKGGRSPSSPLVIGSVKSNLGHTEPTSGLASVIKVVMAMERGVIPPSVNYENSNKQILLHDWNLKIPTNCEDWIPGSDGIRRASVNNFGYGGANAHVILEGWSSDVLRKPQQNSLRITSDSANQLTNGNGANGHARANGHDNGHVYTNRDINGHVKTNGDVKGHTNGDIKAHTNGNVNGSNIEPMAPRSRVFLLSAKDEKACRTMANNLKVYLESATVCPADEDEFLLNLSYTLAERRSRFPWAVAVPAVTISQLAATLGNNALEPRRDSGDKPRIGFVFTGQGAQWHAMGRELLSVYPLFRDTIMEADGYLKEFGASWSLLEELQRDAKTTKVHETWLGMPVCAAVQIALVRLLESWGITPDAVCSHSSGEIAAAYTVGALTLKSAMASCYSRSEVASGLALSDGGMLAVGLGADATNAHLEHIKNGEAKVACINSPSSVTVSGDVTAIEELEARLKRENVFARRLRVRTAFHSHHMAPLGPAYLEGMKSMGVGEPGPKMKPIIFASPTTGRRMSNVADINNPEHWVKSMISPVLFVDAFKEMSLDLATGESEVDLVIEVGPHAALSGPIADLLLLPEYRDKVISYDACLIRNTDAVQTMQNLVGQLVTKGVSVNLGAVNYDNTQKAHQVVHGLPPYPWSHQTKHWSEPRINKCHREKQFPYHDLLGSMVTGVNAQCPTWRHIIRTSNLPWLSEHTVQSKVVYPGAGYICMAIEAMIQFAEASRESIDGYHLRDVDILNALVVPDGPEATEVQITMKPVDSRDISMKGWNEFQIFSVNQYNKWTEHCKGFICLEMQDGRPARLPASKPEPFGGYSRLFDPAELYANLRAVDIYHGPTFQNLDKVRVCDGRSLSMLSIPDVAAIMPANYQSPHVIHPTMLDAVFVSAYSAILDADPRGNPKVPRSIKSLWISNSISTTAGHKYHSYVDIHNADSNGFNSTIHLTNSNDGEPISDDVLVVLGGFACQSIGGGVALRPEAHKHDICSKVEWRPDISFLENAVLKQEIGFPIDQTEMQIIIDLRRACFHYIRQALSLVTVSDVQGLEKHHKKYYTWMKSQLASAALGELGSGSSNWINDSAEVVQQLFQSVASSSVNGEAVCRLGPQLHAILDKSVTPLELLMEDKLLFKYYQKAVKFDRAAIQVGKIMKHLTYKNPRLRILEIGAGTGGSTRRALEAIGNGIKSGYGPMAAEYHFTDISSGFFGEARAQFEDWSDIMSYRKLDIEQDPASQGFELGSFDVIIASQVLHATTSMKTTMTHVRSLLKDGGKLVLMESTKNQVDMQFVFGTLPGWWLSMEKEREFSPILPLPLWDSVLRDANFTGVDFEVQDCESDDIYTFSVITSTAQAPETSLDLAPIAIVTGQDFSPQDHGWLGALQRSVAIECGVQPEIQSLQGVNANGKICIFVGEMRQSVLTEPSQEQFKDIRSLALQCNGLFWVTRGGAVDCDNPELSLSIGFLRSLRKEIVDKTYISFDLDPSSSILSIEDALLISKVFASTFNSRNVPEAPRDFEFAERENQVLIPRLLKDFERNDFVATDNAEPETPVTQPFHQADRTLKLRAGTTGLLETLVFDDVDVDSTNALPPACIEVQPRAFGLNFRDVMAAMGQLQEKVMGLECAGVVTRVGDEAASKGFKVGDRVFCLLSGQFQNVIQVPWSSACSMPIGMDFGTAASIPMIFATAYIGLYDTARLSKHKSVLIHASTGGVGQAAIHLAKLAGSEIFATAGTQEKRDLLVNMYGIPADHVFSSRDASFAKELMKITNNRGVDVVLNSLSGQLLQESFNCLAPCGHFVEIGKFDIEHNHRLALETFSKAVSFSSIDLLAMVRREDERIHQVLASITKLFEQKRLEAVRPVTVYPLSDVEKAFRQMQTGKHIGKIVLSAELGETIKALPRQPAAKLRQDASYLIVGGVGGIGKSIARWMLDHGAKNLILLSRSAGAGSAGAGSAAAGFVAELEAAHPGSEIMAMGCDISDKLGLAKTLQLCELKLPPVRGVVQAAMVLQDSVLEGMTLDNYNAAVRPKVHGSRNLHELLGSDLDFFIMLSSLAGILGSPSQTNYTAGGAYQDSLARHRAAKGLPGVSIDLGGVKEVGYVSGNKAVHDRLTKMGFRLLSEKEVMRTIESAILNPRAQLLLGIHTGPEPKGASAAGYILTREARLAGLSYIRPSSGNGGDAKVDSAAGGLAQELQSASTFDEAASSVLQALVTKLVEIFMIPQEEIVSANPMSSFGVDSLVAVELRNMLALQAGAQVSIFEIMQSPSLDALSTTVAASSTHVKVA